MNFSDCFNMGPCHMKWSPNGHHLAIPMTNKLDIRESITLKLIHTFSCIDLINVVKWADDSSLVLVANFKRGIIEIYQPKNPSWKCKIDEGSIGIKNVQWSPDSRHVLATAEFHLRLNVWSLLQKTAISIKYPKEACPGVAFNHIGDYLAVAGRKDCKDSISIYETKQWSFVKSFDVATQNLAGIRFSHDDTVLAVWDTVLEYKLLIYMINGQCLASYSAYQWAPGIKTVCWSPSSQFIAILSLDQQIRIMNHITWKVINIFKHSTVIDDTDCVIYKEVEKPLSGFPSIWASTHGISCTEEINYVEEDVRPVVLCVEEDSKSYLTKQSNATIAFSTDGRYLASFCDSITHVVWIWSMAKLSLVAVLVQCNPIKDISWNPKNNCLAICTGENRIFFWMPYGCLAIKLPNCNNFASSSLRWQCDGCLLSVLSKDKFTIGHINTNQIRTTFESIS